MLNSDKYLCHIYLCQIIPTVPWELFLIKNLIFTMFSVGQGLTDFPTFIYIYIFPISGWSIFYSLYFKIYIDLIDQSKLISFIKRRLILICTSKISKELNRTLCIVEHSLVLYTLIICQSLWCKHKQNINNNEK